MNSSLKLLSKRLTTLVVSKHCLRFDCFVVQKRLSIAANCPQIRTNGQLSCGTSYAMLRHFSSKINSSEEQPKSSVNNNGIGNELSSDEESKLDLKESTKTRFKKYSDDDSEVIYDVSEEHFSGDQTKQHLVDKEWKETDEELYLFQQKPKYKTKLIDSELKRGVTGVFDIHELVDFLRSENIKDIAVIEVPKELDYCQYLVLGNAISKRHINAFTEYFNKVYKIKKSPKDPFLNIGGEDCPDWKVVDMKNIVLHLFLKPTRDHYDIETLWTVGHEFDDKIQRPEPDSVVDIMEKHIKFLEEIKPKN